MAVNFHEMSDGELEKQLEENRSSVREMRFNLAVARSLQDPDKIRRTKRNIARILTVQRERELKKIEQNKINKGKRQDKKA